MQEFEKAKKLMQGLIDFQGQPYDTIIRYVAQSNASINNEVLHINKLRKE